jgi:hypothetical protein
MPAHRTRREKLEAVVLADALNSSEDAGKRLGIAGRSIRRWRDDPELAEMVQKTRDETSDDVKVAMVLAWELIIERLKAGQIDTKDLIVLGGVSFDKYQLASGGATSRSESRDITGTISDTELDAALREANALATGGRGPKAVEETPED